MPISQLRQKLTELSSQLASLQVTWVKPGQDNTLNSQQAWELKEKARQAEAMIDEIRQALFQAQKA